MNEYRIKSYKDLIVWQKGYELVKGVYKVASRLPKSETFALQSQMHRAAVSIVSNELETQLFICRDLYKIPVEKELALIVEVSKMLRAIINKFEQIN